jgi:hypothetical protein
MRIALSIVVLLAATIAGLLVGAELRWRKATAELVTRVSAGGPGDRPAMYHAADVDSLPAPVAGYFRAVLREGQPLVRHATITQDGTFLLRPTADGWRPFTATQHIGTAPQGFVWDARIRMMPGVAVRVRDGFVEGAGSMHASIMGVIPLVAVDGTPEIAQGALMRYLAEAAWVPTALLPASGVTWAAIDDSSAQATLTAGGTTVSLTFFFDAQHLIRRIYAAGRMREVNGASVLTPWEGYFTEYAERGGMRIPLSGDVGWVLPAGRESYWRGRMLSVRYE